MQQSTFNFSGPQLALVGQQLAINHADAVTPNWSDHAYSLLETYIKAYGSIPFRAEEVRSYAAQIDFPLPPSARAWGSLFRRAQFNGLIKSTGTVKVSNPKAHSANANLWVRV